MKALLTTYRQHLARREKLLTARANSQFQHLLGRPTVTLLGQTTLFLLEIQLLLVKTQRKLLQKPSPKKSSRRKPRATR